MITRFRKVTIIKIERPIKKDLNQEIQYISQSLGLFGIRDKEKSCFRVFLELLKASKNNKSLSSEQIAQRSNLSRATVIHHLNRLMEHGLIIHEDNRYKLIVSNMENLINEMQKNLDNTLKDLKKIAEDIDKELELK